MLSDGLTVYDVIVADCINRLPGVSWMGCAV